MQADLRSITLSVALGVTSRITHNAPPYTPTIKSLLHWDNEVAVARAT